MWPHLGDPWLGGIEEGQATGDTLSAKVGRFAAILVAFMLLGPGERGADNQGEEVTAQDGAAELPLDALDLVLVVCLLHIGGI